MIEDSTKQRLLETAGPLFAAKGFDAVSVRDITKSPAAVNYHFRSKEDLYIETVRHAAAKCDGNWPLPVWPEGVPAERKLRDFVRVMLSRIVSAEGDGWHRQLIFREVADPRPGACEAFVTNFVRPTFAVLQGIVAELAPASSPRTLRLLAGSVMGQILHYQHARHVIRLLLGAEEHASLGLDELADHIARFSLAAFKGYSEGTP